MENKNKKRNIERRVYLTQQADRNLKEKARECGFTGKGWLSNLNNKIGTEEIIFLSPDVKRVFNLVKNLD